VLRPSHTHTRQNTIRCAFYRFKSFAPFGTVSELRDEPVTFWQGTVCRPDYRQHVPVERGCVRPSLGDRRRGGEWYDLRPTQVVHHRPKHGQRGAHVHHYSGPDTYGRQHVVPGSSSGRGSAVL